VLTFTAPIVLMVRHVTVCHLQLGEFICMVVLSQCSAAPVMCALGSCCVVHSSIDRAGALAIPLRV
jgi:hypothetical protein